MVKIFFGCSMRGGYSNLSQEELRRIPEIIEKLGYELVSKHQTERKVIERENKLTTREIHDRDYNWLLEADIGIFEITNGSIGTGEEISDMINLGKPVLCLYRKSFENSVSAYGRGKQGSAYVKSRFECFAYENAVEVKDKIKEFVESSSLNQR